MRQRFIYGLYWIVEAAALPLLLVYLVFRILRNRRYLRGLGERFGFLPHTARRTGRNAVWLHAVSVGEVLTAIQLVRRLPAPCFLTCSTLAGRELAEQKLQGLVEGVFYAPLDYRFMVRRFLRALRPAAVVIMETEIWPNLYREAKQAGAALVIVNGRISDRAIGRYQRLAWFFRAVLQQPDRILVQSEKDRLRYLSLGAPPEKVVVGGNLKYDFEPPQSSAPQPVLEFLERARPGQIWIAASTMPPAGSGDVDEDDVVIEAFFELRQRRPDLALILAPRRPERFEEAAGKLTRAGIPFLRRSASGDPPTGCRVLLLDSIGELSSIFPLADVVFMGGSLARRGGHNILEPAFAARPIVVGPHMENFATIAEEFRAAAAMVEIGGASELAGAVEALLADGARRAELGSRAKACAQAKRGAVTRALEVIEDCRAQAVPQAPPHLALAPLAALWRAGGALRAWWQLARRKSLRAPVISIGGIGMGGAGKTPFVLWLAERLKASGFQPAILTRGYRRKAGCRIAVFGAGAKAPAEETGDEAQLFLRSGAAPVGIARVRYDAGKLLERRFPVDVFLLDDGFQHRRLERQLDIVLIDALDPLAGGRLFPVGRLREPLRGLARAGAFVITRCPPTGRRAGIEARLRRFNPRAPIFHARVVPCGWVEARTGQTLPPGRMPDEPVAAFCGLANPDSFWQTLAEIAVKPAVRREFPDHHRYSPREIEELARAARVLLTTEKDAINLPSAPLPCPVYWLKLRQEVDEEADLLRLVSSASRRCL